MARTTTDQCIKEDSPRDHMGRKRMHLSCRITPSVTSGSSICLKLLISHRYLSSDFISYAGAVAYSLDVSCRIKTSPVQMTIESCHFSMFY